jgi:hypothetical protein
VDPSTEYARTLRHLQASDARWRAEKIRAQSYTLGTQGVGGSAGGHRPFGGVPPPPQPRLRESGGDAPTHEPRRVRFAHGAGNGHTFIARNRCIGALAFTPPPPPPLHVSSQTPHATPRLFRFITTYGADTLLPGPTNGPQFRTPSPVGARSTLITSAPISASSTPVAGLATTCESSTTRSPASDRVPNPRAAKRLASLRCILV